MINSYPSVYAIGHNAINGIFDDDVIIEEKIDGSQFSFGFINDELQCRSKGKQIIIDAPEGMFQKAVDTVKQLETILHPNWIYRCEFLQKPHHNTLSYQRVPKHNLILFDINSGLEEYLSPIDKHREADYLDLEFVPLMYTGKVINFEMFKDFLNKDSVLGGCKVEGIVVKNYSLFTKEKKVAIGKYVSEAFKEVHEGEWRKTNPTSTDIIQELITKYRSPARWAKAVQHFRDNDKLENSPRDIGLLIKEIPEDILKECEDEIKQALFNYAWSKIKRGVTAGFPEWYKDELAKNAFSSNTNL